VYVWCLGMWFSGGLGGVRLMVGLNDLKGLFHPKRFYDSLTVITDQLLFELFFIQLLHQQLLDSLLGIHLVALLFLSGLH